MLQAFPIYEVRPTAQQSVNVSRSLAEPSTYLVTLFNLMLDRLGTDEIQDLTVFMEEFQPLHWASVCAGTDSPVLVCRALASALTARNCQAEVRHRWSSEVSPSKRDFLRAVFPDIEHLYGDVAQTAQQTAYDYAPAFSESGKKSVTKTEVPKDVMGIVGGFPCKDVSAMNAQRGSNREHIQQKRGETGKLPLHPGQQCLQVTICGGPSLRPLLDSPLRRSMLQARCQSSAPTWQFAWTSSTSRATSALQSSFIHNPTRTLTRAPVCTCLASPKLHWRHSR